MEALPKRHILIPVDESASSEKVVRWAVENVIREGDLVHLLHVIPPGQYVVLSTDLGLEEIVEDDESTQKKVEDHARSFISARFVPMLQIKGVTYQTEIVKFSTDNDSIGAIVCKRAEQVQASLIIMGKHARGAIKEFFVGSVCNYCTHHAKAPVLVMHNE